MPSSQPSTFYLNPGDYVFGKEKVRYRTILGSCVSVTFWHPGTRVSAMCHYLLPTRAPEGVWSPDGRYGDEVLELISNHFRQQQLPPEEFQVKLFGGGNMFPALSSKDQLSIGDKNVSIGRTVLRRNGYHIAKEDVGLQASRTVVFDVGTGRVWIRRRCAACDSGCADSPGGTCPRLLVS